MQKYGHLLPLFLAFVCTAASSGRDIRAQPATAPDIKSVVAQGRVVGTDYRNDYFHVIVHVPGPNTFQEINTIVTENRAQLLNAANTTGSMEQRHSFAIVVHSSHIPGLQSTSQFVRSVRHSLEREGLETVTSEVPVSIDGHAFIQSTLRKDVPGEKFYKGVSCTMLNGYIFGIWVEAANEAELNKMLDLRNRLKFW
jgi:hypothetical protein